MPKLLDKWLKIYDGENKLYGSLQERLYEISHPDAYSDKLKTDDRIEFDVESGEVNLKWIDIYDDALNEEKTYLKKDINKDLLANVDPENYGKFLFISENSPTKLKNEFLEVVNNEINKKTSQLKKEGKKLDLDELQDNIKNIVLDIENKYHLEEYFNFSKEYKNFEFNSQDNIKMHDNFSKECDNIFDNQYEFYSKNELSKMITEKLYEKRDIIDFKKNNNLNSDDMEAYYFDT